MVFCASSRLFFVIIIPSALRLRIRIVLAPGSTAEDGSLLVSPRAAKVLLAALLKPWSLAL